MDIELSGTPHKKRTFGVSKMEKESQKSKKRDLPEAYDELLDEINKQINDHESKDAELLEEEVLKVDTAEVLDKDDVEVVGEGYYEQKFKSGEVAKMLGITDQTLRNICTYFKPILGEVDRKASGHRLFSKQDIENIREILEYKNKHGYNNEQTLKGLQLERMKEYNNIGPDVEYNLMRAQYEDSIRKIVSEAIAQYSTLLLESETGRKEEVIIQLEKMKKAQEKSQDELMEKLNEKDRQIEELLRANQEMEGMLNKTMTEKNEELISSMRELLDEKNKKKGFFPWSKK